MGANAIIDYIGDGFLLVDAIREWDEWRLLYDDPTCINIMKYLPFFSDAKALSEQIEAMERGLA